jgi:transcriptional regulator with XRE-family HTH domain
MPNAFGDLHKEFRQKAKKTLADVAKLFELSISYISDVERGHRAPYSNERIKQVAKFFNTDAKPLLRAASECRGFFELSTKVSHTGQTAGASLMRVWDHLSEEDFQALDEFARNRSGETE